MKLIILSLTAILAGAASTVSASTIAFTAPGTASGVFDVVVNAIGAFDGRDLNTDGIISYGFDISITNPAVLAFTGATSGALFDSATTLPGTDVFGAASGFGIFPPVSDPLPLVTLHFIATGNGTATIVISSDLSDAFQGLQFINDPFQTPIDGRIGILASVPTPVPEPGTGLMAGLGLMAIASMRRLGSAPGA